MPVTLILVRHGESTANVDRIFANRPGSSGDLTPAGVVQAEALARSLESAGLTHLYSSPLSRALQTAEVIARHAGLTVMTADELREYDVGEDEGFPYTGDDAWRWERYEAVQRAWRQGDATARHVGGESLAEIEQRIRSFLHGIATRHAEGDVVLGVGHGGTFHAALPLILPSLPAGIAQRAPLGHGDQVRLVLHDGRWQGTQWAGVTFPSNDAF